MSNTILYISKGPDYEKKKIKCQKMADKNNLNIITEINYFNLKTLDTNTFDMIIIYELNIFGQRLSDILEYRDILISMKIGLVTCIDNLIISPLWKDNELFEFNIAGTMAEYLQTSTINDCIILLKSIDTSDESMRFCSNVIKSMLLFRKEQDIKL